MRNNGQASTAMTVLLTALAPILWGSTYLVTTKFLPESRPLLTAAIRTLPAGLLLIVLTRSFRPSVPWGRLVTLSIMNIGAFQALLFVAAYRLPGGIAAVAGALQPVIVMVLAWGGDQDRPGRIMMAAGATGIVGMALLLMSPGASWDLLGVTAALLGAASMACGTFLSRRWRNSMPVQGFTGWQLALGGLAIAPLALALEPSLPELSTIHWLGYGYLSIPGTLVAYCLWFAGISRLSPVAVSGLGLLSPLTAVTLGWFVLDESFSIREMAGMVLVLASVSALQITEGRQRSATMGTSEVKVEAPSSLSTRPALSYPE